MELANLQGSPQQIAAAEKIRDPAIEHAEKLLETLRNKLQVTPKGDWRQLTTTAIQQMRECTSAAAWLGAREEAQKITRTWKSPSYALKPASIVVVKNCADKLASSTAAN